MVSTILENDIWSDRHEVTRALVDKFGEEQVGETGRYFVSSVSLSFDKEKVATLIAGSEEDVAVAVDVIRDATR